MGTKLSLRSLLCVFVLLALSITQAGCTSSEPSPSPPLTTLEVILDGEARGTIEIEDVGGVGLDTVLKDLSLVTAERLKSIQVIGAKGRQIELPADALRKSQSDFRFLRWEGTPLFGVFTPLETKGEGHGPTHKKITQQVSDPVQLKLWTTEYESKRKQTKRPRNSLHIVIDGLKKEDINVTELGSTSRTKEPGRTDKKGSWFLHEVLALREPPSPPAEVTMASSKGALLTLKDQELNGGTLHFVHPNKRGTWTYKSYSPSAAKAQANGRPEPTQKFDNLALIHITSQPTEAPRR